MLETRIPKKLVKGDTIGLIAPSSDISKEDLEVINNSVMLMEVAGFNIKFAKNALKNTLGYGATAKEKAEDINEMFRDEEVKAIFCISGGFNSNVVFEYLNYDFIRNHPKIICGFSDSTSLTNNIYSQTGVVTFSGPTFKALTSWQTQYGYEEVIKRFVEGGLVLGQADDEYKTIKEGKAKGILVGGNLSLLNEMISGKYSIDFTDKIVFMEELFLETPPALVSNYFYHMKQNGIFDRIKGIWLGNYDGSVAIEKILNRIKSKTVISTRETLHLFLEDTNNKKIKNKIYFFHCQAEIIDEIFPGIMGEINKRKLTNTVFVTEKNKNEYIKKQQYDNYERSLVLGNALERKNVRNINKIEVIPEKEKYYLIYLLRISQERKCDIENLIEFGKYLKEKNIKNIVVDVFGDGDYVENFVNELVDNELTNFIKYKGKTNDSTYHIRRHDALVDFTLNHSFGMTYIEGILSGKSVYCMKNTGSIEVMEGIPNSFIESYEDLVNKINKLTTISVEQLQENYRKIEEKYSRKIIAKKFIEYIDRGAKNE